MKKYQIIEGGRGSGKTFRHVSRIVLDAILMPNTMSVMFAPLITQIQTGLLAQTISMIDVVSQGSVKASKSTISRNKPGKGDQALSYWVVSKPAEIRFSNGSCILFFSADRYDEFKGRALENKKMQWGCILLDEFATYNESTGREILTSIGPTLIRHTNPDAKHFLFDKEQLDLDRLDYNDNGTIAMVEGMDGTPIPKIIPGKHSMGAKFLIAYNPPDNKYNFVYDVIQPFRKREDSMVKMVNYTDIYDDLVRMGNYGMIAEAESMRVSDYAKYLHVWLGQAVSKSGLFFQSFEPHNVTVSTDKFCKLSKCVIGVDVGAQNMTTFVFLGKTEDDEIVVKKAYGHSNRDSPQNEDSLGASDYAEALIKFAYEVREEFGYGNRMISKAYSKPIECYIDPSARLFINEVNKQMKVTRQHPIKVWSAYNNRLNTLQYLHSVISQNKFFVLDGPNTEELTMEFAKAEVDKDKEDIVKKDDHYIDAIRYGAWKLKNR
jgi:phage terminase large subunit